MKILTDSAADLPVEEIASLGISVVPLTIKFPEGEIRSDQLSPDDFYNRLRAMAPGIPTTSQPSAGTFSEVYKKLAEDGEEILSIHISSGLSGTLEAARLGKEHAPGIPVTLVDTMTLSGGERYQVLAAVLAGKAGWSKKAILERLESIRKATEVVFTLDTLEYLAKGGRIGRIQALAGSLLHLKPVIRVDKADGKYSTAGRGRTLKQAMEAIVKHLFKTYGPEAPLWVTIMHGQFTEQAGILSEMLGEKLKIARLEVLRVSPALGVHTGPGVVGAAVVPMSLMDGLQ